MSSAPAGLLQVRDVQNLMNPAVAAVSHDTVDSDGLSE